MSKPIDQETFAKVIRTLAGMIITARKDAAVAKLLVQLPPSTPAETRLRLQQETEQGFEELRQTLDETPVLDALEVLRRFEGTIQ